jgi:hypothetical protein
LSAKEKKIKSNEIFDAYIFDFLFRSLLWLASYIGNVPDPNIHIIAIAMLS